MLALVEKLLADLHFREQGRAIQCASFPRLLVFARLLQIGAIARNRASPRAVRRSTAHRFVRGQRDKNAFLSEDLQIGQLTG